jgi:uncharacterized protein YecE (DUF72 family)
MGDVLVGTASWTDKTLLESGWYPGSARTAADRLAYYASQFPLVEVDSTYYSPPAERTAELWRDRTPARFTFNIKAFSLLTHHPTRPDALYKDLRERTGGGEKNLYLRDLDSGIVEEVWDRFLGALAPLHEAGKLGGVLMQFPPWFPISRANKNYIVECKRRSDPVRIFVEFRNRTWMSEENQAETLTFLTSHDLPYVSVDMPQGYPSSIPPTLAVTSDLAVVRFHGHSQKWDSHNIHERFGYLYSADELRDWAPKLRGLAEQAPVLHVVLNNCYRDYAQRNASQLMRLLSLADSQPDRPTSGVYPPHPASRQFGASTGRKANPRPAQGSVPLADLNLSQPEVSAADHEPAPGRRNEIGADHAGRDPGHRLAGQERHARRRTQVSGAQRRGDSAGGVPAGECCHIGGLRGVHQVARREQAGNRRPQGRVDRWPAGSQIKACPGSARELVVTDPVTGEDQGLAVDPPGAAGPEVPQLDR